MSKIKCFKCDGKGSVQLENAELATILSFGLLAPLLFVTEDCDACRGKGYIND